MVITKKILLSLVFIICLSSFTLAISVSPASTKFDYANGGGEFKFRVGDVYNINVGVGGSLEKYSTLLTPKRMEGCHDFCEIRVKISLPDLSDSPGTKELSLVISEDKEEDPYAGTSATAQIITRVSTLVPYPGKYIESSIKVIDNTINVGESMYFVVNVEHFGGETIDDISGEGKIFPAGSPTPKYFFPLSSVKGLNPKEIKEMKGEWNTKDIVPGKYRAEAHIKYDGGKTSLARTVTPLIIGEELVKVISVTPTKFEEKKIQKISANLQSFWNDPLSAYVEIVLKDSTGKVLTESQSKTISLGKLGKKSVETFLDLNEVSKGTYSLEATSLFSDKKNTNKFEIVVVDAEEEAKKALLQQPKSDEGLKMDLWLVVLIIILVLLIIGAIFYYFKSKKGVVKIY